MESFRKDKVGRINLRQNRAESLVCNFLKDARVFQRKTTKTYYS